MASPKDGASANTPLQSQRSSNMQADMLARKSMAEGPDPATPAQVAGASYLVGGSGPLRSQTRQIPTAWLDDNGHVNESRYLQLFSNATDLLERHIGADEEYRSKTGSYFTVETHLFHLRELYAGDRVHVLTQVLGADDKRLHVFHVLAREGDSEPAATGEQMLVHVEARSRRSGPVQDIVRERVLALAQLHAMLPRPKRAGACVHMR
jgi:carnitine 3-dehydrogenase